MNEERVGNISNHYGGLWVTEHDGKYYWGIEDYMDSEWEEITQEVYEVLRTKAPCPREDFEGILLEERGPHEE